MKKWVLTQLVLLYAYKVTSLFRILHEVMVPRHFVKQEC